MDIYLSIIIWDFSFRFTLFFLVWYTYVFLCINCRWISLLNMIYPIFGSVKKCCHKNENPRKCRNKYSYELILTKYIIFHWFHMPSNYIHNNKNREPKCVRYRTWHSKWFARIYRWFDLYTHLLLPSWRNCGLEPL